MSGERNEETSKVTHGVVRSTGAEDAVLKEMTRARLTASVNFYEKLAALAAGSIAVAVSAGVAILNKTGFLPHHHMLAAIVLVFWISLMASVAHNFAFMKLVEFDATLTSAAVIHNTVRRLAHQVWDAMQLSEEARTAATQRAEQAHLLRHRRYSRIRDLFGDAGIIAGYLAISAFVAAYTLIAWVAIKLWWT